MEFSHHHVRRFSHKKFEKYLLTIVLMVCTTIAVCACSAEKQINDFTQLESVYDELQDYNKFELLDYSDDKMTLRYVDGITEELENDVCPQTKNILCSAEIKYIFKQKDDIYFVIAGVADNYYGYILSQDTQVEMENITTVQRLFRPCKYKVFYFTAQ